jgi:hypothetical protein
MAMGTAMEWKRSGAAGRSARPKGEILAHFQANNARSAPFFCMCVGIPPATCKQHFRSIFFAFRAAAVLLKSEVLKFKGAEEGARAFDSSGCPQ